MNLFVERMLYTSFMPTSNSSIGTLCLYNLIYKSKFTRCVVLLFLVCFTFLPLAPIFAAPLEDTEAEVLDSFEHTEIATFENDEDGDDFVELELDPSLSNADVDLELAEFQEESEAEENETVLIDDDTTSSEVDLASSSDSLSSEPLDQPEQIVRSVVNNDANFYQFSKTSCVPVKGGSFYCSDVSTINPDEIKGDSLFSAPDSDGDLEIFVRTKDGLTQISFNEVDDAAPYFDQISNTIVWHRLINDRYQIVSYDVSTGNEYELTRDVVNNMEPHRFGKYTVWQRWVNDNWEIVLFDGDRTSQITTSANHDIAPQIRGEYVLWKTITQEGQVVSVYDMVTKSTIEISGEDSNSILSNPRMVLVYDSISESGEKVTKGFNPATGELIVLNEDSVPEPINIPKTDETGETRALISSKGQSNKDQKSVDGSDDSDDDLLVDEDVLIIPAIATTTLISQDNLDFDNTLDLSVQDDNSSLLSENTLVIPLYNATSTTE